MNIFTTLKGHILAHKKLASIGAILIAYGAYAGYGALTSTDGETRYVTTTAAKETIMTTVTGTGQVTTLDESSVKPKVSGEITAVLVEAGDEVTAGQAIARIDSTDAYKAYRDAQTALESAKLTREDTLAPLDELTLMQLENTLARAETTKQTAEDTLAKSYDDGFNDISNAFLDLPGIVSGLHDLLFNTSNQLGGSNVNNVDYYGNSAYIYDPRGRVYRDDTTAKYQAALTAYNKNFADYKLLDRSASTEEIEAMLKETYATTLSIADAVKSANNLIQFYQDQMTQHGQNVPTLSNTHLNTLNSYTGTANSNLTSLLSIQNTIKSNKNTIVEATRSIAEDKLSLEKKKAGADALEIRSLNLTVSQREDDLADAAAALADYTVRAPFNGVIAKVSAKKGDTGNTGTEIATLITKQKVVELSLNEVDAAAVKIGQKVTLTFDAVEDLSLTGKVASIDTIGTVSSGVVSYTVDISFDTQDDRVKSGMSANATIVTAVKTDVLTVPSAAVKSQNGTSYVLVFETPIDSTTGSQGTPSAIAPTQQTVTTGIAGDSTIEILSGIKEGTQVVTKTITGTTATTKTTTTTTSSKQTTSAASLLSGNGGGGPPRD